MNMVKFDKKLRGANGAAPLRNLNVLDELVDKSRNRALHLPGIVGFSGPSGFGKSTAAAYIAAMHQSYYIEVRSTWTKKAFLEALLQQMGLPPAKVVHQMMDQVTEELAASQRPVIIDEFDNAVERGLIELVRDMYEQSKSPIVIIGEERLPLKLIKSERFHGRIMEWSQALPADLSDARALNKHYTPDVTVKDDLLEKMVKTAGGSVRRIVTNLDRITQYAKGEGLSSIDAAKWGARELHTGAPPKLREY